MSARPLQEPETPEVETEPTPVPPAETPQTGYGHRAHSPDPDAKYGFEPGPARTLPHDKNRRWRVPG